MPWPARLVLVLALGMEPVQVLQPEPVPEAEPELARHSARESDHPKIHAVELPSGLKLPAQELKLGAIDRIQQKVAFIQR